MVDYPTNGAWGVSDKQWDDQTQAYRRMQAKCDRLAQEIHRYEADIDAIGAVAHALKVLYDTHTWTAQSGAIKRVEELNQWCIKEKMRLMDMMQQAKVELRGTEKSMRNM